jgi:hypothetical protein
VKIFSLILFNILLLTKFASFSVWEEFLARKAGSHGAVPLLVPGLQYACSYAGTGSLEINKKHARISCFLHANQKSTSSFAHSAIASQQIS